MKTTFWRYLSAGVKTGGRSGAILGMVLIIVLVLSLVGLGLMQLGNVNAVEVSRSYNLSKAFWRAEAGLFHARARLLGDENYRIFPGPFFGESYTGTVSSLDGVNFAIVSTGTVQGAIRKVAQSVKIEKGWPDAFDYSIYSGNQIELRKGTTIIGDIFATNGFKFVAGGPTITGTNYDGNANATTYPTPTPIPPAPILNTAPYNELISNSTNGATTQPLYPYNLSIQGTNYLNLASFSVGGRIDGPGTLVVYGDVSVSSGSAVIGNNVTIIAGGSITLDKDCTAGFNDVYYANSGFNLAKNNSISIGDSALITPGNINIKKDFNFSGMIYAGGTIDADMGGTITGSVVAVGSIRIKMDYNIVYDAPSGEPPPGFEYVLKLTPYQWSELFH